MARSQVGRLEILLEAQTRRFQDQIDKATQSNKKLASEMKRVKSRARDASKASNGFGMSLGSLKSTISGLLPVMGAAGIIGGFVSMSRAALQTADDIANASKRIGFGIETLQALQFHGMQSGVAIDTLNMALQRFSRRIGQAFSTSSGELVKPLEALGIEIRNADGSLRDINELLKEYAQAALASGSASERNALLMAAFDSEGLAVAQMLPTLAGGMDKATASAREFGGVIDAEVIQALQDANTAIDTFTKQASNKFAMMLGRALIPSFGGEEAKLRLRLENLQAQQRLAPLPEQARMIEELERALKLAETQGSRESVFGPSSQYAAPSPSVAPDLGAPASLSTRNDFQSMTGTTLVESMKKVSDSFREARDAQMEFTLGLATSAEQIKTVPAELSGIERGVLSVANSLESRLTEALATGENAFQNFGQTVTGIMQSVAAEIMSTIVRTLLINRILGFLGGSIPGLGGVVPKAASGAIVSGATPLIAGEMGPEAVVPLRRGRDGRLGIASSGVSASPIINVTVNNSQPHSQSESQSLGKVVARAVQAAFRDKAQSEMRPGGVFNPLTSS